MERFARQIQLNGVGPGGQEKIAAWTPRACATATPGEDEFMLLYASRCGMTSGEDMTSPETVSYPSALARHFRHEPSRDVGVGAALAQLQVILALES